MKKANLPEIEPLIPEPHARRLRQALGVVMTIYEKHLETSEIDYDKSFWHAQLTDAEATWEWLVKRMRAP